MSKKEESNSNSCDHTTQEDCAHPFFIPVDLLDVTFEEHNFTTLIDLEEIPSERDSVSRIKSDAYERPSKDLISTNRNLEPQTRNGE